MRDELRKILAEIEHLPIEQLPELPGELDEHVKVTAQGRRCAVRGNAA